MLKLAKLFFNLHNFLIVFTVILDFYKNFYQSLIEWRLQRISWRNGKILPTKL